MDSEDVREFLWERNTYRLDDALCTGEHGADDSEVFGVGHSSLSHVSQDFSCAGRLQRIFGIEPDIRVDARSEDSERSS